MDIQINDSKSIIFDLDDTLYNELDYLKSAYKEIAKTIDRLKWLEIYSWMFSLYRNNNNVFDKINTKYGIDQQELKALYRSHCPNIEPFNGVIDFFEKIKNKNGKIGIITDGRKLTQNNKLEALGIKEYLDCVVISEEIGTEKPAIKNYQSITNVLKSKSYTYVADNLRKDFITPNKLGWDSLCLIDNGLNVHNNSYLFSEPIYTPNNYFLSYLELNVV